MKEEETKSDVEKKAECEFNFLIIQFVSFRFFIVLIFLSHDNKTTGMGVTEKKHKERKKDDT
jgi:hypothetical protein